MPSQPRRRIWPTVRFHVLVAAIVVAGTVAVHAHDILIRSSLDDGPIRAGAATNIVLGFNAKIEVGLSRVLLLDSAGKKRTLKVSRGEKPGDVVVRLPALKAGKYGLRYRILSSDGHLTDEMVRFRVVEGP